ncbi:N-acetyltransferase SLI1 [Dirofilaria immitis]
MMHNWQGGYIDMKRKLVSYHVIDILLHHILYTDENKIYGDFANFRIRGKIMSNLWKWFTGKRNECSVTYSRFGLPGDVLDDRPRPSTICIAQFNDNDPKFIFFRLCHAQEAAAIVAGFGMSSVIIVFISVFFEFGWYNHKTGVDLIELAFLFLYLGIGILVHYQVIAGIKKQASYYLLPFIISYIVTVNIEALFVLVHILHLHFLSLDYSSSDVFYLFSIPLLFILILFQGFMLKAVCQCRYYLSCKEIHLTALKVAESSRTKYPGIRVIFASPAFTVNHPVSITNGNKIADGVIIEQGITSTW